MQMPAATRKSFQTSDGATLSYVEAGRGQPLVMIPGWSQTAAQWHHQVNYFAETYHVIALDMRGHGESENVRHGYRVHRLAMDLHEFLNAQRFQDTILMGHSMGCAVLWALWDLFGARQISKLIFVDEPAYPCQNPALTPREQAEAGALFPAEAAFALAQDLAGPDGEKATRGMLDTMLTPDAGQDLRDALLQRNLQLPQAQAASLLLNNVFTDWRDLLPRITVPCLCIGGEASNVPASAMRWAAQIIPDAELQIFGADEHGSHMVFLQNPDGFNARIAAFLDCD